MQRKFDADLLREVIEIIAYLMFTYSHLVSGALVICVVIGHRSVLNEKDLHMITFTGYHVNAQKKCAVHLNETRKLRIKMTCFGFNCFCFYIAIVTMLWIHLWIVRKWGNTENTFVWKIGVRLQKYWKSSLLHASHRMIDHSVSIQF